HASRGADFDYVGAIFDDLADLVLHAFHAVGSAIGFSMVLIGQQIVVTMAASDAQGGAAGIHARAGNHAFIDGVAQSNVGVAVGAHIAYRGKSRFQRSLGILGPNQRLFRNGDAQFLIAENRIGGQVRVSINQAWQKRGIG